MNQYTRLAINELYGRVDIGDIVGHESHKLSHLLICIANGMAVYRLPDGTINT